MLQQLVIPAEGAGQRFWQSASLVQVIGHCIPPLELDDEDDDPVEDDADEDEDDADEDDSTEDVPPLPDGSGVMTVEEHAPDVTMSAIPKRALDHTWIFDMGE